MASSGGQTCRLELRPNISRVRDGSGFIGTVLYVGPVASAKSSTEIYAGIAWDDVTRGKHDGSVICRTTNQLVRHFKCGPTQGSFLRLSKADAGVPLSPELMRSRYVAPDAELVAPGNVLPHVARTAGGRDKAIEFFGELKVRKLQQLEVVEDVALRNLGIARLCGEEQLAELQEFRHLKGLDLTGNLLSDWDDVLAILRQFPNLHTVRLAYNRINDMASATANEFATIRKLNVNDCHICTFQTMKLIGFSMPHLESLCIARCDLSDLASIDADPAATANADACPELPRLDLLFPSLVFLDLTGCRLTSWETQVLSLSPLPKLECLILDDNPIASIQPRSQTVFPHLESLYLVQTSLSSWSSIDALGTLPSLKSLRLRNTPLTSSLGVGEVRSTVIARLPRLEYFNASLISERERREAERQYVNLISRMLLLSTSSVSPHPTGNTQSGTNGEKTVARDSIIAEHPRFEALLSEYKEASLGLHGGTAAVGQMGPLSGKIGEDVINVTIRSMVTSSCDMQPLRKRFPRALKVGRIKAMCARAFGVEIDLQILHFRVEGDPFPTELDDAERALEYYGVSDGAEILVNEVDVEARERENARLSEEHNLRVQQQEQHATVLHSMQRNDQRLNFLATEK